MSYMRHPVYAWSNGESMNLWARADAQDEGVYDPINYATEGSLDYPGFVSGVAMPMSVFDQLVVMRYAQLVSDGELDAVIAETRTLGSGNVGSWEFFEALGDDPAAEFKALMDAARAEREVSA